MTSETVLAWTGGPAQAPGTCHVCPEPSPTSGTGTLTGAVDAAAPGVTDGETALADVLPVAPIDGTTMVKTILKERDTCYACVVKCKRVVEVLGRLGLEALLGSVTPAP